MNNRLVYYWCSRQEEGEIKYRAAIDCCQHRGKKRFADSLAEVLADHKAALHTKEAKRNARLMQLIKQDQEGRRQ